MPRKFGSVNVEIWSDPEFRELPPAAQHLYLLLWTAPDLSFCGTHDWRPGRLSKLSKGFTEEHTRSVAECLISRYFLVVDDETEEVLIRSWARFDQLLKQPRLAISYSSAYTAVYSPTLRSVLAHETQKMRDLWPELTCWSDDRVSVILSHPMVSAKELATPQDPFGHGVTPPFGDGFGLGLAQTRDGVWASVYPPPTPAPTPTPSTSTPERPKKPATARKRPSSLPEDFKPNDTNERLATERGLHLPGVLAQFVDHHTAKGSTYVDWHAALNTWIRREKATTATPVRRLPAVQDLELPPDGLSPDEYAEWERQSRARRQAR